MLFFFFNDTATTEIYPLSLHDALPICRRTSHSRAVARNHGKRSETAGKCSERNRSSGRWKRTAGGRNISGDRKSTRLNSSHLVISYAVFCLKKKKKHLADSPSGQ